MQELLQESEEDSINSLAPVQKQQGYNTFYGLRIFIGIYDISFPQYSCLIFILSSKLDYTGHDDLIDK